MLRFRIVISERLAIGFAAVLLVCGTASAQEEVVAVALTEVLVSAEFAASAEVVARNRSALAAELGARVAVVNADVGQQVGKSDVLVELDPTLFRLALQSASANLDSAKAEAAQAEDNLARIQKLAAKEYVSTEELEASTANLAVLQQAVARSEIAVAEAREQLRRTKIRAPFAGVVETREAQVGGYVLPGTTVMTLTELDGREVAADLSPRDADELAKAASIQFFDGNTYYPLTLLRVSEVLQPVTRQRSVRLTFTDKVADIGRSGRLGWTSGNGLIPANLLMRREGKLGVFVVENGQSKFVQLANAQEGRPAPHTLAADTLIVTDGRNRLVSGVDVTVRQP